MYCSGDLSIENCIVCRAHQWPAGYGWLCGRNGSRDCNTSHHFSTSALSIQQALAHAAIWLHLLLVHVLEGGKMSVAAHIEHVLATVLATSLVVCAAGRGAWAHPGVQRSDRSGFHHPHCAWHRQA